MATFSIENFGCRATDADAATLRGALLGRGFDSVADHSRAEIVVLNTCAVTAAAEAQTREAVRKIHRANPAARIFLAGCYAQRAPEELAHLEGVACVAGPTRQMEIPALAAELLAHASRHAALGAGPRVADASGPRDFVPLASLAPAPAHGRASHARILVSDFRAPLPLETPPDAPVFRRTRPILKIQDGCSNRCAFCVIPLVRGRSRSLPPQAVIEDARRMIAAGAKEIVLSGINLGSYGRDLAPRSTLLALVRHILGETAIERLRFSSIEPQDVTGNFLALAAESPRIAAHFHVPLQSGSDRVLRAMRRWYRAAHYAERVRQIRRILPHAAIGADVIAGFPGETEEEFRETVRFLENLPLTYLHVFSFSARPGTEAADRDGPLRPRVIHERARALRALGERKSTEFRASQQGRTLRALTLARQGHSSLGPWTEALTGNYLKVRVPGHRPANEWVVARA